MTAMVGLVGTQRTFKITVALGYEIIPKNCHALFLRCGIMQKLLKTSFVKDGAVCCLVRSFRLLD